MPSTRTFYYGHAPVRVRVLDGEVLWFLRDLAAAVGVRLPSGHLDAVLPGIGTTRQAWAVALRAGCGAPDAFQTWLDKVAALLLAPPTVRPAPSVPRPRLTPAQGTAHGRQSSNQAPAPYARLVQP
ncbi:hypothetical protein [Streptomyces sp. MZ04]|uniref:hypothetical protein n=1 Tax=Streptomyces sp. MZ04 TaxID=2559236 RepID=UPI00107EB289|nr:hypothetical protein [Streptomyces sp. MZ04]TGB03222.1 hypothetical protein E2651_25680 [Streptomyces sp. MZ04]